MSLRVPAAYAAGLLGCASIAYALHGLLSSAACTGLSCAEDTASYVPFLPVGIIVSVISIFFGARLVFAGVFLAIGAGAVTVTGAGSFPTLFGGGFLLFGVLALVGAAAMKGASAQAVARTNNLVAEGSPAVGTVLSVRDTGVRINDNPRVHLRVLIEPEGNGYPSFEAEKTVTMPLVQPILVGSRYPVLFLPKQQGEFGLITDITDISAVPAGLRPVVQRLRAEASGPPAPRQSLSDEIAKLDALHREGALTVQEFHDAKARLLGNA
ncbi:SHOCT domain-containing protein [Actinocorallia longicatena]|uniref:SHOCT domain-containing protein n=1 Tax=Actinocorallia longicatena TaxID=111803 RepID=A0ABP6QBX0_9ACTN